MATNASLINLNITFRNVEATDALKTYANEKVTNCLQKFIQSHTEAHLVLRVEKNRQVADISCHANGADLIAEAESGDLYSAIDMMVDTLTQQLRKHKEKLVKKHQ